MQGRMTMTLIDQVCCMMLGSDDSPGRWWLPDNEPLLPRTGVARPGVAVRREYPCDIAAGSEPYGVHSAKRDIE